MTTTSNTTTRQEQAMTTTTFDFDTSDRDLTAFGLDYGQNPAVVQVAFQAAESKRRYDATTMSLRQAISNAQRSLALAVQDLDNGYHCNGLGILQSTGQTVDRLATERELWAGVHAGSVYVLNEVLKATGQ